MKRADKLEVTIKIMEPHAGIHRYETFFETSSVSWSTSTAQIHHDIPSKSRQKRFVVIDR